MATTADAGLDGVRTVRPRAGGGLVFVCGKCLKRHPDGKAVRAALKAEARSCAGRRKVRIVKTGCVGLCPRRALVLASGATLAAGEMLVVRAPAEAAAAVARLLGSPPA